MKKFLSFGLRKSCQNDEIKNNEMGGSCSASGGNNKCFKAQLHVRRKRTLEGIPEGNETKNKIQLTQDAVIWRQCRDSKEHLASLLDRELIELDSDCQLFKQDFTACIWV